MSAGWKRKGAGLLLSGIGLWNWCKLLVLFLCCLVLWAAEEIDWWERFVAGGFCLVILWRVALRILRRQQRVERDGSLLTIRTSWGEERQFHLGEIGAVTYSAASVVLRDRAGQRLCRLYRGGWDLDELLGEMAALGKKSTEPYVVQASRGRKRRAICFLFLAILNAGLWGGLWWISRQEPWDAGGRIVLLALCLGPLLWAAIAARQRLVRRLLVEGERVIYISLWGRRRTLEWKEILWPAQPGGRVVLLSMSGKKLAVLSGRDTHLYELFCDCYTRAVEWGRREEAPA